MLRHLWRNESEMLMSEGEEAGHSLRSLQDTDQQPSNRNSWPLLLAFTSFLLVFSLSVFATGKHGDGHAQATKSYGSYGDYRSLKGKAMDQLQDFVLHGTIPGECEGCHGPKQTKSICSKGPSTTRRLEAPNNLASTMGQLQDFLNGKPVKGQCPEAEPVLAIAMPVNLKEANGLSELFLPMLIRAARSSVSTMMQVPDQVISVTLSHPVETRLLSMQETVEQAEKGSKFNIVAEVSSPPQEAMQAAMGSQFLEDFQEEVSAALIREGAEAGTGNFHQIAQFDTPVLEEKSSLDVEGFKSEGFGTVCETYRQKQLQPGEVEEKQVGSVRACAQACAGSKGCQGFQFGHAQKTCKLWKTGVCRSQEAVGPMKLECYRKCAT